jgi:WD40 repeat protein
VEDCVDFLIGRTIAGGGVNSLALSHDDKKIALGHTDGFKLLDINDPTNTVSVDKFGVVFDLAFSPDDKKIVTGGRSGIFVGKNLFLWTLLTDQEELLLKQVKNYNADQTRLIYQLCSQFLKDKKVVLEKSSEEEAIFKTLPQDMQNLLNDLFSFKGWLSGWWG